MLLDDKASMPLYEIFDGLAFGHVRQIEHYTKKIHVMIVLVSLLMGTFPMMG